MSAPTVQRTGGTCAPARVHLARLDVDAATGEALAATLDADERARADTLRDPLGRRRWIADHGQRRRLIGALLGRPAEAVRFVVGPDGGPEVADAGLAFSAARSGDVALYATSVAGPLGVDLEEIDPATSLEPLVRRILSSREQAELASLGGDAISGEAARRAAVLGAFSRKEAWGKAVGTGLVFPLSAVEVWAADGRPRVHRGVAVLELAVGPGRVAALALGAERLPAGWTPVLESAPRN